MKDGEGVKLIARKKESRCAKSKDGSLPGPLIPEDIDMPAM
uniref:Mobile element protein n=1 Tax=Steinernema glaseri TaxID=37863 RepID=A0A1I7XYL2_9BILA